MRCVARQYDDFTLHFCQYKKGNATIYEPTEIRGIYVSCHYRDCRHEEALLIN
jgi:hypothetical protein